MIVAILAIPTLIWTAEPRAAWTEFQYAAPARVPVWMSLDAVQMVDRCLMRTPPRQPLLAHWECERGMPDLGKLYRHRDCNVWGCTAWAHRLAAEPLMWCDTAAGAGCDCHLHPAVGGLCLP